MKFSQSACLLVISATVCGAMPVKRDDPLSAVEGAAPGLDTVISTVEGALGGATKRDDPLSAVEGAAPGLDTVIGTVEGALGGAAKRDDPLSAVEGAAPGLDTVIGTVEGALGGAAKRDDLLSAVEGAAPGLDTAVGTIEGALGGAAKRDDPLSAVESVAPGLDTVTGSLEGVLGNSKRADPVATVDQALEATPAGAVIDGVEKTVTSLKREVAGASETLGDALNAAGLQPVVAAVNDLTGGATTKRADPVSEVEGFVGSLDGSVKRQNGLTGAIGGAANEAGLGPVIAETQAAAGQGQVIPREAAC